MSHDFQRGSHSIYSLSYHLVFVTKYRNKCMTPAMLSFLETLFSDLCRKWESELVEFGGESDHVHLLVKLNPKVQPSKLVNNLKSTSSRLIRKQYARHLRCYYWKPVFWSASYCMLTTGGASIETVKRYIENQGINV